MITEKQREARRRNGRLSRGPKTVEGKARASRNAVKYGLFSSDPVAPGESVKEFQAFRNSLLESLNPVGMVQQEAAEQVVVASWKILRCGGLEAAIWKDGMRQAYREGTPRDLLLGQGFALKADEILRVNRAETMLDHLIHKNMTILQNEPTKIRASRDESMGSAKMSVSSFFG